MAKIHLKDLNEYTNRDVSSNFIPFKSKKNIASTKVQKNLPKTKKD